MTALGLRLPAQDRPAAAPPPDIGEAIGRARSEAGVSGAFLAPPFEFHPLDADAGRRLALPEHAEGQTWVLVTVRPSAEGDHRAHLRERCLTAAQRFMLRLACDGIDNVWVGGAPGPAALRAAGVDVGGREPVGLIRCDGP